MDNIVHWASEQKAKWLESIMVGRSFDSVILEGLAIRNEWTARDSNTREVLGTFKVEFNERTHSFQIKKTGGEVI